MDEFIAPQLNSFPQTGCANNLGGSDVQMPGHLQMGKNVTWKQSANKHGGYRGEYVEEGGFDRK